MLVVFKYRSEEDAQSPEFRYLLSVVQARTCEVFDAVELSLWRPGAPEPPPSDGDYVLVLGRENVWMTAATLQAMKRAIDEGADVAVPDRLTDFPLGDVEPIYTARDFEQTERRFLEEKRVPPNLTPSPLSIALLSRSAFRAVSADRPVSQLLLDPELLTRVPALRLASGAGLFLQFPDYYGGTRADLLPYLPATAEDVLEIGCGRGLTGQLIQEALGCRVTGVRGGIGGGASETLPRFYRSWSVRGSSRLAS
jgi:hypothetical protein